MKKATKNLSRIGVGTICAAILTVGFGFSGAHAYTKSNFNLLIGGRTYDQTGDVGKSVANQNGTVYISGTTAGKANMWSEMYNTNGTPRSDAILATYQSKSYLTNNTGLAGYVYYLDAHRQNIFDSTQTFQGNWSPDKY